jgi:preprotein translocase subunit SecG
MDLLQVSQFIIAAAVGTSILLQARGTGLSSTFGGESTAYRSRRGVERTLFRLTVVLVVVFVVISLVGARASSPAA